MAMETLPSNDFLNSLIYDIVSATPVCNSSFHQVSCSSFSDTANTLACIGQMNNGLKLPPEESNTGSGGKRSSLGVQGAADGKKNRRKRARVCNNKKEAETQRITHIVVERNRRRQMNEHLSVLRSLMPQSYAQRGDQASIVGGAIEFLKELEHMALCLEAQKSQEADCQGLSDGTTMTGSPSTPFSQFFNYPQFTWSQSPDKCTASSKAPAADIEVTLTETHANIRILTKRSPRQPCKIVARFQAARLTILHLNISTVDSLVFYSISAKVEEGCPLISVDDIAGAVHHMIRIIEQEEDK